MVQTLPSDAPAVDRTCLGAFRRILREHGPRHFTHGLGTCLVRAFSVNMGCLCVCGDARACVDVCACEYVCDRAYVSCVWGR